MRALTPREAFAVHVATKCALAPVSCESETAQVALALREYDARHPFAGLPGSLRAVIGGALAALLFQAFIGSKAS